MKKCPYCFEEIQEEAKICRFCGKKLTTYFNNIKNRILNILRWLIYIPILLLGLGIIDFGVSIMLDFLFTMDKIWLFITLFFFGTFFIYIIGIISVPFSSVVKICPNINIGKNIFSGITFFYFTFKIFQLWSTDLVNSSSGKFFLILSTFVFIGITILLIIMSSEVNEK